MAAMLYALLTASDVHNKSGFEYITCCRYYQLCHLVSVTPWKHAQTGESEEMPAVPHQTHSGENPAVPATILFFFMCSNITLYWEELGYVGSISS